MPDTLLVNHNDVVVHYVARLINDSVVRTTSTPTSPADQPPQPFSVQRHLPSLSFIWTRPGSYVCLYTLMVRLQRTKPAGFGRGLCDTTTRRRRQRLRPRNCPQQRGPPAASSTVSRKSPSARYGREPLPSRKQLQPPTPYKVRCHEIHFQLRYQARRDLQDLLRGIQCDAKPRVSVSVFVRYALRVRGKT